jgi:hypothetical protein
VRPAGRERGTEDNPWVVELIDTFDDEPIKQGRGADAVISRTGAAIQACTVRISYVGDTPCR